MLGQAQAQVSKRQQRVWRPLPGDVADVFSPSGLEAVLTQKVLKSVKSFKSFKKIKDTLKRPCPAPRNICSRLLIVYNEL